MRKTALKKVLKPNKVLMLVLCMGVSTSFLSANETLSNGQGAVVSTVVEANGVGSVDQQGKTVTGVVVDEFGGPLTGVTVAVKGETIGSYTDLDGNFSITLPAGRDVIVFTYIGFRSQEVKVVSDEKLNIVLEEDAIVLDDIVVTALGIKREKKMLGYSFQDVKSDELLKTGDPNALSALQGKVAGMQMNLANTGLNGSAKVTIRGNSSLTDNNQPLWVVDGVPFNDDNDANASVYGGVDRGGVSFDINPEDIESVSVLKGASAAALYGTRAGNGVILVTTKKGTKKDGFGVSYNTNMTWSKASETLDLQEKYGQGKNGLIDPTSQFSFGAPLDGRMYTNRFGERRAYKNYGNKLKDYYRTGFNQSHNVAIGGVTDKSDFRISLGYNDAKGHFQGETTERFNFDVKGGMDMNKYLRIDAKVALSRSKAKNRPTMGAYGEAYQLLGIPNNISLDDLKEHQSKGSGPGLAQDNWFDPTKTIRNPYYTNKQNQNVDDRWRAYGFFSAKVNITPWLYAQGKFAYDYYRTEVKETNLGAGLADKEFPSYLTQENNFFEYNAEFLVAGNNKLGTDFDLGYTFGMNRMDQRKTRLEGYSQGMNYNMNNEIVWHHNSATVNNRVHELFSKKRINSIFATAQLAYKNYANVDVTVRSDWSSTLPAGNRCFTYPSVSGAFILTQMMEEYDMKKPDWLTFAKARLSFAKVGKDTDPYSLANYLAYKQIDDMAKGLSGKEHFEGITDKVDYRSSFKPEMVTSYEVGFDAKFLNNRLGIDFSYYHTTTKNQILYQDVAPTTGFTRKRVNGGEITNSGVELMFYGTPVQTKDLTIDLTLNLSHNVSKIRKLPLGLPFASLNNNNQMFFLDVVAINDQKLGDIIAEKVKLKDDNGNILLDAKGMPIALNTASKDIKPRKIGNIQPKLLMSFSPSIRYKNLSLSALFDMRFGGQIISVTEAIATSKGLSKRTENREDIVLKGISQATGQANTVAVNAEEYYRNMGNESNGFAEDFMYSASFIKLKELAIGYNFPKSLLKKTPIQNLKLSLVGRNLCYLMKHTPGTSPEGGFDTSMYTQALDYGGVPFSRTFGFSINVAF